MVKNSLIIKKATKQNRRKQSSSDTDVDMACTSHMLVMCRCQKIIHVITVTYGATIMMKSLQEFTSLHLINV